MVIVKPYRTFKRSELSRIISGYTSQSKFAASCHITDEAIEFRFERAPLPNPYIKRFTLEDDAYYKAIIDAGLSLAAYENNTLIALALADAQSWNNMFWLHEFHVHEDYQRRGIGEQLMQAVINTASTTSSRAILLETQNTNIPAIRFYQKMGFQIDAIDLSLYSNHDFPDGEIALFMRHYLK